MTRTALALIAAVPLFAAAMPAGAALQPQGEPVALDHAFDCGNREPAVAALDGGGFVVVWTDGASLSAR